MGFHRPIGDTRNPDTDEASRGVKALHTAGKNTRRVAARCEVNESSQGGIVERGVELDEASRWRQIDDRIRNEVMAGDFGDTLPLPFLATVSSFGMALTGYLTWSRLTNNYVVCPLSGCTSILASPYAQIGPVPLSALGLLGYTTVASLCLCSMAIKKQSTNVSETGTWLSRTQRGILYATSILAGTSIALAVTLKTQFPDETCPFCLASIAASLILYFTTFFASEDTKKSLSFGGVAASTLLITGLYATYPANVTAGTEIPYTEPQVTKESPEGAVELARALQAKGARMYGAFWCSHCFEQKQSFGVEAKADLPYVECYPDGYKGMRSIAKACIDADVQGFPTWIINGQKLEGDWPLPYLQSVLEGADPLLEAKNYFIIKIFSLTVPVARLRLSALRKDEMGVTLLMDIWRLMPGG